MAGEEERWGMPTAGQPSGSWSFPVRGLQAESEAGTNGGEIFANHSSL